LNLIVLALYGLSWIVFGVTIAVAALLFLRVLLTWLGANPFGRIPYHLTRLTEPMVRPARQQFGGGRYLRYDLIPLVMGVLILVTGLFISSMIGQLANIIGAIGRNVMLGPIASSAMMGELIRLIGLLYVVAIFLRFFLPFFGVGYRNNQARGTAMGDEAESMYMVVDGDVYNGGCCFEYGNMERNSADNGEGAVEAVYFGTCTIWGKGAGTGPWVMGDLEPRLRALEQQLAAERRRDRVDRRAAAGRDDAVRRCWRDAGNARTLAR